MLPERLPFQLGLRPLAQHEQWLPLGQPFILLFVQLQLEAVILLPIHKTTQRSPPLLPLLDKIEKLQKGTWCRIVQCCTILSKKEIRLSCGTIRVVSR